MKYDSSIFILLITTCVFCLSAEQNNNRESEEYKQKKIKLLEEPLANEIRYCPKNFNQIRNFCYTITEKQNFPPKCPYPNAQNYQHIPYIVLAQTNTSIWVNARRDSSVEYGPFEWYDYKVYKNPVLRFSLINFMDECLIFDGIEQELKTTDCSNSFPTICSYDFEELNRMNYCKLKYNDETCIINDYDFEQSSCYCLNFKNDGASREEFCNKLAEPIHPFQTQLLLQGLKNYTNNENAWFGLEKSNANTYIWSSSKQPVDYTYWASKNNLNNPFGALTFDVNDSGWILEEDKKLNWGVCETPNKNFAPVKLTLRYDKIKNNIKIYVKNIKEIYEQRIYCFSDVYGDINMKTKYEIDLGDLKQLPTINNLTDYPSRYWCIAMQLPTMDVVISNTVIAYDRTFTNHGHTIAFYANITFESYRDAFLVKRPIVNSNSFGSNLEKNIEVFRTIRPLEVISVDLPGGIIYMLCHVNTKKSNWSYTEEISRISGLTRHYVPVSSEVCLPSETNNNDTKLTWIETPVGEEAISQEICLQDNYIPVTRKCEGDFLYGAYWSEVKESCSKSVNVSDNLEYLNVLLQSSDISTISYVLTVITNDMKKNGKATEVHYVSLVLDKLASLDEEVNIVHVTHAISNVMQINPLVLEEAQTTLNSTDKILSSLDKILNKATINNSQLTISSPGLLIEIIDPITTDVRGIALRKIKDGTDFTSYTTVPLYKNITTEALLEEDIELAMFIPSKLMDEIHSTAPSKMVISIFYGDVLFNEVPNKHTVNSWIISVSLPQGGNIFEASFPIIYKRFRNQESDCAYWDYGKDGLLAGKKGYWNPDVVPQETTKSSFVVCEFDHLTHFALV